MCVGGVHSVCEGIQMNLLFSSNIKISSLMLAKILLIRAGLIKVEFKRHKQAV